MTSFRNSTSLANQVVFSIILGGYSVSNIVSTTLVWARRNKHPLKGRHPRFLLLFNVVALVITVLPCINAILPKEIPCLFLNTHLYSWYLSSYSIRAFVLWFQFEQVQEALQHEHSPGVGSSWSRDPLWFSKRRHLISERYTFFYALASFLFCFASVPYLLATGECYTWGTLSSGISAFNDLVLFGIGVFLGFKLRKEFDLFWLRQEFMYNSAFCVVALISWMVISLFYFKPEEFYATSFLAVSITSTFLIFSSIIPLWLSYKAERERHSRTKGLRNSRVSGGTQLDDKKSDEIIKVLEDAEGYKLLENYMAGEFAVENITFYKACKEFQGQTEDASVDKSTFVQRAWEIYTMFMKTGAPQEINISLASKDMIKNRILEMKDMSDPSAQEQSLAVLKMLLEESLKEVLRLISKDAFLRFKRLPEAQQFLKKQAASQALSSMELL